MLAIIKTGGKQYKVKAGAKIKVEKLPGAEGGEVKFPYVLLIAEEDGTNLRIGKPEVAGVSVSGKVLKQARTKKIDVIKYKRKVRYRRQRGHRQYYTEVLIEKISA